MYIYSILRVFMAYLFFSEYGLLKDKELFLCVRRFIFIWATDHEYEIIVLAGQCPEPKHANYINTNLKKTGCQVPITNVTRGPEIISPNLFCEFIFTKPININLDPLFLYNPLN